VPEMTSKSHSWVVITEGYINSWSFVRLLKGLAWPGNIVVLTPPGPDASMMELWGNQVQLWTLDIRKPEDLLSFLKQRIPKEEPKALFFTEESLMPTVHKCCDDPWMRNARVFPGPECALETILDRTELYRFIEDNNLGEVPRTIDSAENPLEAFPNGFFIRFRQSWDGFSRLPRPRLVESAGELQSELKSLRQAGWKADQWCYQEKLSIDPRDNVSISGWHNPQNPSYVATRKVLQYPARQGGGAIVEAICPPRALFYTTAKLLEALRYEGPFELEYVLDPVTRQYRIIELNPRLWMQHELHGAITGQIILRRYLDFQDGIAQASLAPPVYWINGVVAIHQILSGNRQIWRYLLCPRRVVAPNWSTTFRWLPRFLPNLVRRNLHGWRR